MWVVQPGQATEFGTILQRLTMVAEAPGSLSYDCDVTPNPTVRNESFWEILNRPDKRSSRSALALRQADFAFQVWLPVSETLDSRTAI